MHREKYPEKVPFRLTRHLIKGMEMSGIEGNYRFTCENVMSVMRSNKDSLMAVLEAFVHDPLINWRLIQKDDDSKKDAVKLDDEEEDADADTDANAAATLRNTGGSPAKLAEKGGGMGTNQTITADEAEGTGEELNERAITVIARISNKLTGRDFDPEEELTVPKQVDMLIRQATSHENLASACKLALFNDFSDRFLTCLLSLPLSLFVDVGWCPWW